nr:substrate-binding domain-containing protein [Pontiella sulfatireligans]
MLQEKGIPVVNVAAALQEMPFPTISFDNAAIGRMAAEHLLHHNLDRFAFIGPKDWHYSVLRCNSFADTLAQNNAPCTKLWIRPLSPSKQLDDSWIETNYYLDAVRQLQPPIGVFASNDRVGYGIIRACRRLGLRIPEDICLIGADNDHILCKFAYPNLSSIALSGKKFGYKAAQMLDAQMRGKQPKESVIIIPPEGIILRNSSDFLNIEDTNVADALRYIRNHAGGFIDVSNVVNAVPPSRRVLERRFQDIVGHGIYQEIGRCHVERAKELLKQTNWPISRIAQESGFNTINRFKDMFRKITGLSATAYRKGGAVRPKE